MTDRLFAPEYDQPLDVTTQVTRMPGTVDAECLCPLTGNERIDQECLFPFCDWEAHAKPPARFPADQGDQQE